MSHTRHTKPERTTIILRALSDTVHNQTLTNYTRMNINIMTKQGGLAAVVFGVIASLYYFRSRAWATDKPGASSGPGYRRRAKTAKLDNTSKPNGFKRKAGGPKAGQVAPEGLGSSSMLLSMSNGAAAAAAAEMGVPVSTVLASLSPTTASKKQGGFWQMKHHKVDPITDEQQDDNEYAVDGGADLARWGEDDVDVRELVERLQRHHDAMESEFAGQKVCVMPISCLPVHVLVLLFVTSC
jgi:hypothetical protein